MTPGPAFACVVASGIVTSLGTRTVKIGCLRLESQFKVYRQSGRHSGEAGGLWVVGKWRELAKTRR